MMKWPYPHPDFFSSKFIVISYDFEIDSTERVKENSPV